MVELLRTKLFIPRPRSNLVSRLRLIERLNTGLDKKLTLIAAPVGFGKTTLLSEWIPQSPRCVTWLSLDESDNDPTQFWIYLISSLQELRPDLGASALALLQSPQAPPTASILTSLINDLIAFPDTFVAVLDDYHLINIQPIHAALTFLIDHQPANMHLVITTRVDPPLPLARLRARDELTELRANDLRFTIDETASFLNQVMRLSLSVDEVAALETRTEGWIAGLQIAALTMQSHEDIPGFIHVFSGSHRHILGYLAEEVLNHQTEDILHFLLQTSILDRLCGPLCDAVTGVTGGQAILEKLEHTNLFITPLDDEGRWYRYHHLFAEVLRNRLERAAAKQTQGIASPAELHRRASSWFEGEGLIDDAIRHALGAPDVERAAFLVEKYSVPMMIQRSEVLRIRAWLDQLPEELVRTRPRLILAHGWTLILTGHIQALEGWLATPHISAVLSEPDLTEAILGELTLIQATLARFQRKDTRSLELAQQALGLLTNDTRGLQAGAMYTIGIAYLHQGKIAAASEAFLDVVRLGEAKGDSYMVLSALQELSELQIKQAQLSQAIDTCQQAMTMSDRWQWRKFPAAGLAPIYLGHTFYERNDLAGAVCVLSEGVNLLLGSIEQFILARGFVTLTQAQMAGGNLESAFATLQRGRDWFTQMHVADTGAGLLLVLGEVRLWIQQGNLSSASRWAQNCDWRPEDTPLGYLQAVTLIRLRLAQHRHEPAEASLHEAEVTVHRLLASAEAIGWWGQVIELSLLRALLCQEQHDTTGMLASLERALTLAEPEGYVRSFVDEGEAMRLALLAYHESLRRKMSDKVDHVSPRLMAYTQKLVAAFPLTRATGRTESEATVEALTEREQEILNLLAEGFSNQEIAGLLVIGLSTVKSHINSLYSKLGTHRRTQAIIIARDQGLLSG